MRRLGSVLLLLCPCGALLLSEVAACAQFAVHPNGAITYLDLASKASVRFEFGLPGGVPEKQGYEAPQVPVVVTTWFHEGIRYSQTVFLSESDPPKGHPPGPVSPPAAVLFVRLAGLNTTNEYTLARAALALKTGGEPCPIELRDQLVYTRGSGDARFVAALDLPSGASARPTRDQLEFEGKMPPGTTGSLDIRIPIGQFDPATQAARLQDLDFDEEYQRVKKAWTARAREGSTPPYPLTLSAVPK